MFESITYTRKIYALLASFIILLLLSYKLVFVKTFTIINDNEQMIEKLSWLKEKEKELPSIQKQIVLLDKNFGIDSLSIRDQLTAFISDYATNNNCIVTEIPNKSYYVNTELNVQTNKFTVRGDFKRLLTLLYKIESVYTYSAKIVSAKFYSQPDMKTKRPNLYLELITQSFNQVNTGK